jgi:radical SAM/Cys-rich protein
MNDFEKKIYLHQNGQEGLFSNAIDTLQINLGLRCNQKCLHCHLESSPERQEMMDWPVMELIINAVKSSHSRLADLTGGAPELNPHFRRLVSELHKSGCLVQVRTNLTIFLEPSFEDLPEFIREHAVQLVASLPCYTEENVCAQRGSGVFERSIKALRWLNALGYGVEPSLVLNLMYNPGGPFLPAPQLLLEEDYRRELGERFGIVFTRLFIIANMPLGRYRKELIRKGQMESYMNLLRESFNSATVPGLMCRHQVSIGWNGTLYDCDFNLAISLPVNHGAPDHIQHFQPAELLQRRIMTGDHCFGCTAGAGSSCSGSILRPQG